MEITQRHTDIARQIVHRVESPYIYEQQVVRGHIEPVDDQILIDIRDMRLARRIGCSLGELRTTAPQSLVDSALIEQEFDRLMQEQQRQQDVRLQERSARHINDIRNGRK